MVNANIQSNGFPQTLNMLQRTQLINFMTDGSLFTDDINSASWTLEGITNALNIANLGIQALKQVGKLREETMQNVNNLLKRYKEMVGNTNKYETIALDLKKED